MSARVWLPAPAPDPAPLLLLPRADAPELLLSLEAAASAWAARGAAVALVDLPLCGARRSAKLSRLLAEGLTQRSRDPELAILLEEFFRQSASEQSRALDSLASWPELDVRRSAAIGFELGALVVAAWCAAEPRLRAVALGSHAPAPPALCAELEASLQRFAPRPLLRDAGAPKPAIEAIWRFLEPHLAWAPRS